jgi:hypothetical protein
MSDDDFDTWADKLEKQAASLHNRENGSKAANLMKDAQAAAQQGIRRLKRNRIVKGTLITGGILGGFALGNFWQRNVTPMSPLDMLGSDTESMQQLRAFITLENSFTKDLPKKGNEELYDGIESDRRRYIENKIADTLIKADHIMKRMPLTDPDALADQIGAKVNKIKDGVKQVDAAITHMIRSRPLDLEDELRPLPVPGPPSPESLKQPDPKAGHSR